MRRIHTYYMPVPEIDGFDSIQLISLWRKHWRKAGWDPYVLNEYHARIHPLYKKFAEAVDKLPTVNPKSYEYSCFLRHLALATVGGGWMADYDVFPTGSDTWSYLDPVGERPHFLFILQTPCCPSVMHATPELSVRFCQTIIDGKTGQRPQDGRAHTSDQYCLEQLHMDGERWIQIRDIVKLWTDKKWEEAPLVHYANAVMVPAKKKPRWMHIEGLLK